ncbi:g protein-coupled receptor [Anaeramoeba ignava]|uniref:G protein-coupled receptor n=1 Tax=Anaeramoeba ignava TaxID=1746090 RepID=A0A9Q0LWD2_ANAIG|nr:g protein-coupled receptor [Anaeramoeba ignava]
MAHGREVLPAIIGGTLGLFGSLVIMIVHIAYPSIRNFFRKLIFILSIYDLLLSIGFLINGPSNHILCRIQTVWGSVLMTATPSWTATISFITYLKIVKSVSDSKVDYIQRWLHFFTIFISLVICIIWIIFSRPEVKEAYWCFEKEANLLFGIYCIWWFFLLVILIFYILCLIKIRQAYKAIMKIASQMEKLRKKEKLKIQLRMTLIPIVYILTSIPSSIKRARDYFQPNASDLKILDVLQALFLPSQGIFDCFIFVFFVRIVRKKIIDSLFKCCRKNQDRSLVIPLVRESYFSDEFDTEND